MVFPTSLAVRSVVLYECSSSLQQATNQRPLHSLGGSGLGFFVCCLAQSVQQWLDVIWMGPCAAAPGLPAHAQPHKKCRVHPYQRLKTSFACRLAPTQLTGSRFASQPLVSSFFYLHRIGRSLFCLSFFIYVVSARNLLVILFQL